MFSQQVAVTNPVIFQVNSSWLVSEISAHSFIVSFADKFFVVHEVKLIPCRELTRTDETCKTLEMINILLSSSHYLGGGNGLVAACTSCTKPAEGVWVCVRERQSEWAVSAQDVCERETEWVSSECTGCVWERQSEWVSAQNVCERDKEEWVSEWVSVCILWCALLASEEATNSSNSKRKINKGNCLAEKSIVAMYIHIVWVYFKVSSKWVSSPWL